MEPRPVQKTPEDVGHGAVDDPGTVVLDGHRVLLLAHLRDLDHDVREDLRLLAGVERVVDRFLHAHQERFGAGVEPEDLFVLLEKLRDRYLVLLVGELFGRSPAAPGRPYRRL